MKSQKQQRKEFINALRELRKSDFEEESYVYVTLILDRDKEGQIIVSAEDGRGWADYYQEYLTEYMDDAGKIQNAFGIATALNDLAEVHGFFWEWENPGAIIAYEN